MRILSRLLLSGLLTASVSAQSARTINCSKIAAVVTKEATAYPHNLLTIVRDQAAANPSCACEVVKAAIVTTEAYPDLVAQVVAAAVEAAPDQFQTVTACALAIAPDARPQIEAALAKLGYPLGDAWKLGVSAKSGGTSAKSGGTSAKGAKGGVAAGPAKPNRFSMKDPLDDIYLVPDLQPLHPPIVTSTCSPDDFPNVELIDP